MKKRISDLELEYLIATSHNKKCDTRLSTSDQDFYSKIEVISSMLLGIGRGVDSIHKYYFRNEDENGVLIEPDSYGPFVLLSDVGNLVSGIVFVSE